jgi:hypothetical protein
MQLLNLALILCVASAAGSASAGSSARSLRAGDSFFGNDVFPKSVRDKFIKADTKACIATSTPDERKAYAAKLDGEYKKRNADKRAAREAEFKKIEDKFNAKKTKTEDDKKTFKKQKEDKDYYITNVVGYKAVQAKQDKQTKDLTTKGITADGLFAPHAACPVDLQGFWGYAARRGTPAQAWHSWCKRGMPDTKTKSTVNGVPVDCAKHVKSDPLGEAPKKTVKEWEGKLEEAQRKNNIANCKGISSPSCKVNPEEGASTQKKIAEAKEKITTAKKAVKDAKENLYGCKTQFVKGGPFDIVKACNEVAGDDEMGDEGDQIGMATLWCAYVAEGCKKPRTYNDPQVPNETKKQCALRDETEKKWCCPLAALAPKGMVTQFQKLCGKGWKCHLGEDAKCAHALEVAKKAT